MSAEDDYTLAVSQTRMLLSRIRGGDHEALDGLFARHRGRLERFARTRIRASQRGRLGSEDVVQEVLLRAYKALDRFEYRGVGSFWMFLRTIAWRFIREQNARGGEAGQRKQELADDSAFAPAAEGRAPASEVLTREALEAYERALETLPATTRQAVLLRLELGLGYAEIASECDLRSPDAARMAITRALEKLATEMGDVGP